MIQVPKIAGGAIAGFQVANWRCHHIDDLQDNLSIGSLIQCQNKSLGELFLSSELNLDLLALLKSVIYSACAKIVDHPSSTRSVKRLSLLVSLISKNQHNFPERLIKRAAQLQHDRETFLSSPEHSRSWFLNEASKLTNVVRHGTLKNSCIHYIETRLGHLIAGLISILDTNQNLDILVNSDKKWVLDLWAKFFDDQKFLNLDYSKQFVQANQKDKTEFICISQFVGSSPKVPFSWMIKETLDELTRLKISDIDMIENNRVLLQQVVNAFKESYIYKALSESLRSESIIEFTQFYLSDFLLLSTKGRVVNSAHFDVILKRVKNFCFSSYSGSFLNLDVIVKFHLAYEKLAIELDLFANFVQVNPGISDTIRKNDSTNSNLCLTASRIICAELSRTRADMKASDWDSWFAKAQRASSLIERFILQFPVDSNLEEFRSLWQKVLILQSYVEHLCSVHEMLYVRCITLWNFFRDGVDLKRFESFEKLINFLSSISENMSKKLAHCKGCNKTIDKTFYETVCRCIICENCKGEFETTKSCSVCNKKSDQKVRIFLKINV